MLSEKVKEYCKSKGWWYEDYTEKYEQALTNLNIDLSSDFAIFFLHVEDGPTFFSRYREIYQVCWFVINSNYQLDLDRTHQILNLPSEFMPLDSFEGQGGFFYNKLTGAVFELELGQKILDFQNGKLAPQWDSFNDFLEWFFELN
ncbi:hypothetical protein [Flavobacterium covae]|uniref:hypothetical protein n=1 Tax=Flavobacterium covae TaxID=2906076 RepID=UPI0035E44AC4